MAAVRIGLIGGPGEPGELAEELAEELPEELAERFPDVEWHVEVDNGSPFKAVQSGELVEYARRRLREEGWRCAVCLTDLPLRSGRRPVVASANPTTGVGLLSVPALGVIDVEARAREAVANLVEGLVHETVRTVTLPVGRRQVRDDGSVRFAAAVVRGNLRLLAGMVRANDPSRVVTRLSRALTAALGAGAIALASANIWKLADGMTWGRLAALCALSVLVISISLIMAHGLWEQAEQPEERERVVLFNAATTMTILIGVLTLYLALFAINLACAGVLIPLRVFDGTLGHSVGVGEYVSLAWLVSSLATIGGALGSVVESDLAVREAAYRYHPDERIEAERARSSAVAR